MEAEFSPKIDHPNIRKRLYFEYVTMKTRLRAALKIVTFTQEQGIPTQRAAV